MTSGANFIADPREWRLSMDGYTIKTGWSDEKKTIARFPQLPGQPIDNKAFEEWVENACKICDLYNRSIKPEYTRERAEAFAELIVDRLAGQFIDPEMALMAVLPIADVLTESCVNVSAAESRNA